MPIWAYISYNRKSKGNPENRGYVFLINPTSPRISGLVPRIRAFQNNVRRSVAQIFEKVNIFTTGSPQNPSNEYQIASWV